MAESTRSPEGLHHLRTVLTQSNARLDRLPNELLYVIAEYLDMGSLNRLAQSNRAFHRGFMPIVHKKSAFEHKNFLLFWAAVIGNLNMLEEALAAQGDACDVNIYGTTLQPWRRFAIRTESKWKPHSTVQVSRSSLSKVFQTPLHLAAMFGHPEVVNKLLDCGADINAPSQMTCTCMTRPRQHLASPQHGKLYVDNVPWVGHHSLLPVWAPLQLAICHNRLSVARLLLQRGASVLVASGGGVSALQSAAGHGNVDMIKLIAQYGGRQYVNDPCQGLSPPLFWALEALELKEEPTRLVIEALLDLGANINHRGARMRTTPLAVACMTGQFKVAEYLMEMGARLDLCTLPRVPGANLLHMCCNRDRDIERLAEREYNPSNMLSKLVEAGLDLEARIEIPDYLSAIDVHSCCSWNGWTPLWGACMSGALRIVEQMLRLGAKADIQRSNGVDETLLDCQIYGYCKPRLDIMNALVGAGARLSKVMISHISILDHPPLLKMLIRSGICVNSVTRNGMTPLLIAVSKCFGGNRERIMEGIPSESVASLLDGGAAIDARTDEGLGVMGKLLQRGILRNEKMYSLAEMLVSRGAPLYDPEPVYLNGKLWPDPLTRIVTNSITRRLKWARCSTSKRQDNEYTDPLLEKVLHSSVKDCFTKECLERNIQLCCAAEAHDIAEWLSTTMARHGIARPGLRMRTKYVNYAK